MQRGKWTGETAALGQNLKWLSTIFAGIDAFDTELLKQRGTILTNGVGINALAVAEYAVMGIPTAAKRFDRVVRALLTALEKHRIGGAFLDVTTPEPLPADHPLWSAPNCFVTMHLSGRSQTKMFMRAAALFLDNARAFMAGAPMRNVIDLDAGY